jgi:hypothetical protein
VHRLLKHHLPPNSSLVSTSFLNLQPQSPRLLLEFLVPLLLRLRLFNRFPLEFPVKLIWPAKRNILRSVIAETPLEPLFNDPARAKIQHHHARNHPLEVARERHKLELVVQLGDEFRRAREGDARYEYQAPVHALVLADRFAERPALVVDCKGGDLLDELQQVDCRVEEGRLKVFFEVRVRVFGLDALHVLRDVDESRNVDGELTEDGADNVRVEDVVLGALFGEGLDGLVMG